MPVLYIIQNHVFGRNIGSSNLYHAFFYNLFLSVTALCKLPLQLKILHLFRLTNYCFYSEDTQSAILPFFFCNNYRFCCNCQFLYILLSGYPKFYRTNYSSIVRPVKASIYRKHIRRKTIICFYRNYIFSLFYVFGNIYCKRCISGILMFSCQFAIYIYFCIMIYTVKV